VCSSDLFLSVGTFPNGKQAFFLRIGVENTGRRTAEGCRVFVNQLVLDGNVLESEDLMPVFWSQRELRPEAIDLPPQMRMFADIASAAEADMVITLDGLKEGENQQFSFLMPLPNTVSNKVRAADGDFVLTVYVFGGNISPMREQLRFSHRKGRIDEPHIVRSLPWRSARKGWQSLIGRRAGAA